MQGKLNLRREIDQYYQMSLENYTGQGKEINSFEEAVNLAKESALKHNSHMPTLFARGSENIQLAFIEEFGDTADDRARQLFMLGMGIGRSNEIGALEEIIFISEGWMSALYKTGKTDIRPSEDPERIEVLLIIGVEMGTKDKTNFDMFEMIRDEGGKLIELKLVETPDEMKEMQAENSLLPAFIAGFKMGVSGLS